MALVSKISFHELAPGHTVRVTEDGMIWGVDLVMAMTGKTKGLANEVFRRMNCSVFDRKNIERRRFPGTGNGRVRLLTLESAVKPMVMPGKIAKAVRSQAARILTRYFAGDEAMHDELDVNRASGALQSCAQFFGSAVRQAESQVQRDQHGMPVATYVYAFASPAFPGLVKIGRTIDVEQHLTDANTFTAPAPFYVVAVAPSFDNVRDERAAHAFFAAQRREGEFFELDHEPVMAYFTNFIMAQYQRELMQHVMELQGRPVPFPNESV